MRSISKAAVLAFTILFGPVFAIGQDGAIQRSFAGDTVHLELSSGTYRVTSSHNGRIRVIPRPANNPLSVRLDVNRFGTQANVTVAGSGSGSTVEIELPPRVDLVVTMRGASLVVGRIEGNKNISGDTGQIEVAVGNPAQYDRIKATVRSGSVIIPRAATGKDRQRSFESTGSGSRSLTVQLNQGNITLLD
jgi:hypothetical protein